MFRQVNYLVQQKLMFFRLRLFFSEVAAGCFKFATFVILEAFV